MAAAAVIPSLENSILALCLAFIILVLSSVKFDKSAFSSSNISVTPMFFKSFT